MRVSNKRILVVEDDLETSKGLSEYFKENNIIISTESFMEAKEIINEDGFDIILLDVLLPDGNGLDLVPLINPNIPVIILSDLGSEESVLKGLKSGAADYMVKPYSLKVLEQRMLLRMLPHDKAYICINGLSLDTNYRVVSFEGKELNLTKSEFDILYLLMSHPETFYTSSEIYEHIWNMESLNTSTVRYHIHNLREKMRFVDPRCEALIMTKFGGGYAFRSEKL